MSALMDPDLALHPAHTRLRQVIAQLELISHVSGTSYDSKQAKASDEDIGGRRPPGGESDRPARDAPEDEVEAWLVSYQRRTATYFRRELDRCYSARRLEELVTEASESLEAWRRQPLPKAGEPPKPGDPQFKRWVAESSLSNGEIARLFFIPRQYVWKIRKAYRDEAA